MLGIALATTVDHTPLMTPVKNQGGCGSCWAFAATSALEGTIGVNTGVISERLSEQQGVDCTRNTQENTDRFGENYGLYGCSGGWMAPFWEFMKDHGVMHEADYPYMAKKSNLCPR
jgi:C1A family cysteine protease